MTLREYPRIHQLVKSVLGLIQLAIGGALIVTVWVPVVLIVGLLNFLYKIVTDEKFDNWDLAVEPIYWWLHQAEVTLGADEDFRAAPYIS